MQGGIVLLLLSLIASVYAAVSGPLGGATNPAPGCNAIMQARRSENLQMGVFYIRYDAETILPVVCEFTMYQNRAATLLYKLNANLQITNNRNPVTLWTSGQHNDDSTSVLVPLMNKTGTNYVSRLASLWHKIPKASIRLYVNATEKAFVDFDTVNSNIRDFFVPTRTVASSWTDVVGRQWGTNPSGDFFSIDSYPPRVWYINQIWNGCPDDWGNMVVMQSYDVCEDIYFPGGVPPHPNILYSTLPGKANYGSGPDVGHAEVFSIWADIPDIGLGDVPTWPAKGCNHIMRERGNNMPTRAYYIQYDGYVKDDPTFSSVPVLCDFTLFPGSAATMVYKISAGVGGDAVTLFSQTAPLNDGASHIDTVDNYWSSEQYVSRLLSYWSTVTKASVQIWKDGTKRHYVNFDAANTGFKDWFKNNKIIDSSWTDLAVPTAPPGGYYFQLDGPYGRHWYINTRFGGCPEDQGHLLISSVPDDCEGTYFPVRLPQYNVIMYAPETTGTHATRYELADLMSIWVVMDDIDNSKPGFSVDNPSTSCTDVMKNSVPNNKARGYYFIAPFSQPASLALCDFTIWSDRGATMMFKIGNDIRVDAEYFWSTGQGSSSQRRVDIRNGTGNFRSPLVDSIWNPQVVKARMGVYMGSHMQEYIDFAFPGATGVKPSDFFDPSYATFSTWEDLLPFEGNKVIDGRYFSITGNYTRRWYLNWQFGGCGSDQGWLLIKPTADEGCAPQYFPTGAWRPQELIWYADGPTKVHPSQYVFADSMVVWADIMDDVCATGNFQCTPPAVCQSLPGTRGAHGCGCLPGYTGDGTNCADINECNTPSLNKCDNNANCINFPGSFRCDCKTGFYESGGRCLDINECLDISTCPSPSTCNNTQGSFNCVCPKGYNFNTGSQSCVDINECTAGTAGCSPYASCTNNIGGFACICNAGYSGSGLTCTDINECTTGMAGCSAFADCANTQGSYNCTCKPGFVGGGFTCVDVDECTIANICPSGTRCTNSIGSFSCSCLDGYTPGGSGGACVDINECAASPSPCPSGVQCTNLPGSFSCECPAGTHGNPCVDINECVDASVPYPCGAQRCTNIDVPPYGYTCSCAPGYSNTGSGSPPQSCIDVNECTNGQNTCNTASSTCLNTPGDYECSCKAGYTADSTGKICNDINECNNPNLNNCGANSLCTNSQGSYSCSCKAGYEGNPTTGCTDINECTTNTYTCSVSHSKCLNTAGSYTCVCADGYTGDGTQSCTDINECANTPNICGANAVCGNTDGGYSCTCNSGYAKSGTGACVNINECLWDSGYNTSCSPDANCIDKTPGWDCACKSGFTGDGKVCNDINECDSPTPVCTALHSVCLNNAGSYRCFCADGYQASQTVTGACEDTNECLYKSSNNCSDDAICKNTDGSFVCTCKDGFSGNGNICAVNVKSAGMSKSAVVVVAVIVTLVIVSALATVAYFYIKKRGGGGFSWSGGSHHRVGKEMDTSIGLLGDDE